MGTGRKLSKRLVILGVLVLALPLYSANEPSAAQIQSDSSVLIDSTQTVDDDLYLFGGTVNVQGAVEGDLILFGGTVTVTGAVAGDILVFGGSVTLLGEVGGTIRSVGGTIVVGGQVGSDVAMAGGKLSLSEGATLGRDLLVAAENIELAGTVGRHITGVVSEMTLLGQVEGDVRVRAETLRLQDGARIGGNLLYESHEEAEIAEGATVEGITRRAEPDRPARPPRVLTRLYLGLRFLVGLFLLGLLFVLPFRAFSARSVMTLRRHPWASLGLGFAFLIIVPLVASLIIALGVVIGGWWIGLMLLAIYWIAAMLALVVVGLSIGRSLLEGLGRPLSHTVPTMLLGLVILVLLILIPYLGPLVVLVSLLLGLGALVLAIYNRRKSPPEGGEDREAKAPQSSSETSQDPT